MNLFSGLKGEGLNKEKGILEILNPLSRQDAYHKLFVRKSRLTTEHVFVSFVDESFSSIINDAVYLCTDGKVYDIYVKLLTELIEFFCKFLKIRLYFVHTFSF